MILFMDVTELVVKIIEFVLSFVGALGVLFLFPFAILGIVLLVVSTTKAGDSKKKFRLWGIISLVMSVGLILIPIILFALLSAVTTMY